MGSLDVGWSDLGSWTALLAALAGGDGGGATGRVLQPGERVELAPDDLVIRPVDGGLVVEAGSSVAGATDGSVSTDGVWAHLAGARHLTAEVQALLDRVGHQESRV
jgi:hypothetical protein